jgi:hypothetical protein
MVLLLIKREASSESKLIDDIFCFSAFSLIFLLIFYQSNNLLWPLLVPVFHGGSILNGLIAILLYLKALGRKSKAYEMFLYSHMVISSFSDPLVVAQFYIPLALITILIWVYRCISAQAGVRIAGLVLLSSFVGIFSQKLCTSHGIFKIYSRLNLNETIIFFSDFIKNYFSEFSSTYLANFYIVASFVLMLLVAFYFVRVRSDYLNSYLVNFRKKIVLTLFPFFSIMVFLFSYRFTSAFPILTVHGLVLFFVPPVAFFMAIMLARLRYISIFQSMLIVVVLILVFFDRQFFVFDNSSAFSREYYPAVAALDEISRKYKLKYGFSDYLTSKGWSILNRSGLFINQLGGELEPMLWVTNAQWYLKDKVDYKYPDYNFIVAGNLPGEKIIEKFGVPREKISIDANNSVFIYDRPSDIKFRNFFKVNLYQYLNYFPDLAQPNNNRLKQYKPDMSSSDEGLKISNHNEYVVDFDRYTFGNVLETSLSSECSYNISVNTADDSRISMLNIPKGTGNLLSRHYICVKSISDVRPVTYLKVIANEDNEKCSIGDAFIYEDKLCEP